MIRFTILQDGVPQTPVDTDKTEVIIGRGTEADVQLSTDAVSRRHARLTKSADGWQIADLGSANGVYVATNGGEPERVVIRAVSPGDKLHIESFILSFEELEGGQAAAQELKRAAAIENAEAKRTQFISMTDVLAARQAAEGEASKATKTKNKKKVVRRPVVKRADTGSTIPAANVTPSGAGGAGPETETDDAAMGADANLWWVYLSSGEGHGRTFTLRDGSAQVGSGSHCEVLLPKGPKSIVALERSGEGVNLKKTASFLTLTSVRVDGRKVRDAILVDGDTFEVGGFEVRIHLRAPPAKSIRTF
jgi:pSer/pThr/pTyr-binding forkhead associated (FHA) protein